MTTTIYKRSKIFRGTDSWISIFPPSPKLVELIVGRNFDFFQEISLCLSSMRDVILPRSLTLLIMVHSYRTKSKTTVISLQKRMSILAINIQTNFTSK